ncbi:MAG: hypothetical protein ACYC7D_12035 [Nitrososphaerales archaeon]
MTDPLTGRELVEKSYEYLDRLTKECSKVLLDDYGKSHKKFSPDKVPNLVAEDVVHWFEKREKNVSLTPDPVSVSRLQPNKYTMKLKGSTKDADFELGCAIVTFLVPGSEYSGSPISFVKSFALTADKTNFTRRK